MKVEKLSNVWTCKIDNKIAFEIHYQDASSFKTYAELYTPEGYFVKYNDEPIPKMIDMNGSALSIGGIVMSGNKFIGCRVGIWLRKDGSLAIGVN